MTQKEKFEIFVRGSTLKQLIEWFESLAGPLEITSSKDLSTCLSSSVGTCVITSKYRNGPFSSVKIKLQKSLWPDSFECAKHAAADLGCVVRCLKGKHIPEHKMIDGTPMYVEFDGNKPLPLEVEKLFVWRSGPDLSLLERFLNFRLSLVVLMDNIELAGSGFDHDEFEGVVESVFDITFASYIRDEFGLPMDGSSYNNFVDGHGIILKCSDDAKCLEESRTMSGRNLNEVSGASVSTIIFDCFWNPVVESDSWENLDYASGFPVRDPKDLAALARNDARLNTVYIPIGSIVDCEIWTTEYRF